MEGAERKGEQKDKEEACCQISRSEMALALMKSEEFGYLHKRKASSTAAWAGGRLVNISLQTGAAHWPSMAAMGKGASFLFRLLLSCLVGWLASYSKNLS